jgi:hypothetical protein
MCNLLFTYELARRLPDTGVTINAMYQGLMQFVLMHDAAMLIRGSSS